MSEAGRTDRRDCGAAVIWVLACSAVLMVFAVVIATRTAAVFARHRAEAAADLAALAAAGQIGVGDEPCAAAAAIARRNVAAVGSCTVALDPGGRSGAVIVSVVAHVRLPVIGTQDVTASARAARLPDVAGRSEGAPAVRPGACAPVAGWRSRTSPESGFLTAGQQRPMTGRSGNRVDLAVTRQGARSVPVVAVTGEVDVSAAPALRDGLIDLLTDGGSVIVDLTDVGFLDSTGLGALVAARTAADERGASLSLVCTHQRVLKLFTITGLDGVFTIYDSVEDALAALAAGAAP